MGKSKDSIERMKEKSKSWKKIKIFRQSSLLYNRIASVVAAKKRGKAGKRSNGQDICSMLETAVNNSLQNVEVLNIEDKPLFAKAWGVEFWNFYSKGKGVLETGGANSATEQIAWISSAAADAISRKEKEGLSFNGLFILFLVPTPEKAFEVRQVWKPLETVGIYTLGLHPGTSKEQQIRRLKSCEPEFIVSTPERLLDLLSLKAVDISEVSLLVIDGLEAPFEGSYFDAIKSIRQFISGNPRTVAFTNCKNKLSISLVQNLMGEPEWR